MTHLTDFKSLPSTVTDTFRVSSGRFRGPFAKGRLQGLQGRRASSPLQAPFKALQALQTPFKALQAPLKPLRNPSSLLCNPSRASSPWRGASSPLEGVFKGVLKPFNLQALQSLAKKASRGLRSLEGLQGGLQGLKPPLRKGSLEPTWPASSSSSRWHS